MAKLLDLLVDRGVLLDISVALRNVGLRLVVVIVGDEIDYGVIGKELAHLACNLSCECLVGLHDERRLVDGLNRLGHGVGLAGARNTKEGLVTKAILNALRELGYGLGLVARRLERRDNLEGHTSALDAKATELSANMARDLRLI